MGRALDGKIIVITGASSGIGRAAARLFAVEGARLALVARSKDSSNSLAAELGSEHLTIAADLTMGLVRRGEIRATLQRAWPPARRPALRH